MYTVIGFQKVLPDKLDDYIANLKICAVKSNQESGCIRYEVMQDADDPTLICLFQIFADSEAYQFHQDAEHHTVWMNLSQDWRDPNGRRRNELTYVTPAPGKA